ncbi:MAG: NAD-dependent dehydratase [Candidatus Magasanikbacteria bacterium CG10_big_fil_rev_8_21_14_0_10_36_32]|uniref:NAD-dependent dehydratase n=1 Tax=Candidatus Magasanikbacteria bacterium CG10_big_fil_rev_8_21_14_0_10_36_32 TaxID=1974646 RepID=A0A2M6W647_9BACT|nr:MAG: NAD-dependent dehydratase [Candidatus Magasanikbacteria bacterium CG10_big_fil_rev_8_21_14_0_10_36_32]
MDTPIFEKKNVLVTGGAGFIGSHLCERLLKDSKVICIDDFSNSNPQNITHLLQYPDFEFINCDVAQPIDLDKFEELNKFKVKFQGIQEIYHLACPTSPKDFERFKMKSLTANSSAMLNTLDLAVQYHAKYVFASSSVVYGNASETKWSFKETDQGVVDHLSSRACYDEGKRFAETCVETYRQVHGVDAKIARIFTTYGPRMRLFQGLLIPDFVVSAIEGKDLVIYGDENMSMSLCYISDMITGLTKLMASDPEVKIINLGDEKIIKLSEVAQMIIQMTNSNSKITFENPLVFLTTKGAPDLVYVKDVLGWMPLTRLEDGLEKTIEYVVANKEALLFNHKN